MKWSIQLKRINFRSLFSYLGVLLLFASACGAASAATQQLVLNNTWSDFDPFQLGAGVQTLSAQSSAGFTSAHSGAVSDLGEQPRVYQEFTGLDFSQVGQKLTASFDVQFHNAAVIGDTQFRFGFGDTTTNQGMIPLMIDLGTTTGSSFRQRYDDGITYGEDGTQPTYEPGNYSGFLSSSGTFGGGGGNPTGVPEEGLGAPGSLDITHTLTASIERVERLVDTDEDGIGDFLMGGWYCTTTWTNDVPDAEVLFIDTRNTAGGFAFVDPETGLGVYPDSDSFSYNLYGVIKNIDTLGFLIFNNQPFAEGAGSYTISNLFVEYDDGALTADFEPDGDVDSDDLTILQTNYGLSGSATMMQGDTDADMDVDGRDFLAWQREYTGPAAQIATINAVPEPSALLLTLAAALSALVRRQRNA